MTKSNIIGIHGGHAVIGSRGAKGYLDEVNVDRKLVKYIKEYSFDAISDLLCKTIFDFI